MQNKKMVFISYSSEDSVFADLVKLKLNAANIDVWMDQEKLNAGREWRNDIDDGIKNCDVLLVILTPESCNSPYVTYEWAFAIGRDKMIIPLVYKKSNIHPRIDVLQFLDFTDQRKGPWDQLFNEIEESHNDTKLANERSNLVSGMTVDNLEEVIRKAIAKAGAAPKTEDNNLKEGNLKTHMGQSLA